MDLRSAVRRISPFWLRLRVVRARRRWRDRDVRFASQRAGRQHLPVEVCAYDRPFIDYPHQETLGRAKRRNQRLLAAELDGVLVAPGETFSVWKLARRPGRRYGYAPAAALKNGQLRTEPGGAICLLSTVLYNVALLSGMRIVERHCHSVDSYGDQRYFELGRDAAIEYGYLDLRFENPHGGAVMLCFDIDDEVVRVSARAVEPLPFWISFDISSPEPAEDEAGVRRDGMRRFQVHTQRVFHWDDGKVTTDDVGYSVYRIP